ncbi:MAG TPA: outer membrane protein assembly factor BamD [Candidatus Binatia bacterium]|nr:outer membrane protein assembly factor BamD [Candidatus Binatia bacterium]
MLGEESTRELSRQASLGARKVPPRRRRPILLLGVVLSLAGCAEVGEVTGVATQQDIFQIRQDVVAAQQAAQRSKTDADSLSAQLERRVREQTGESERQVAALTRQLDGLSETLTTLAGRVDELGTRLDTLNRQLRVTGPTPSASTPAIPRPPTGAPATASPSTSPGTAPGPIAAVPSRPTTGSLQPQDIYQAAYIDFSKGSYSLAIAGFREFLRRYPDHELAGSGQYWIGEAYLSLARGFTDSSQGDKASESLEQAVQEFKKVLANYPRADKVPTALYKEALALIDLKQPALAQARLQYLVDNFPRAEETPLARERLAALKSR